ncbi:hypothetical protein ILUMI_09554 [Ignelater luminosus]|uniref:PH domain-containing protein n=1 Tax=Ignelater luminosus TaxID=2038154 RepID=A0A8K0GEY0_IGNLU|nr:hypothetical protein ILUMI_09554 [Ignelater luminosus]
MDPFTEKILERARQRQKNLIESHGDELPTPLKEFNPDNDGDITLSPFDDDAPNIQKGYENEELRSPVRNSKPEINKDENSDVKQHRNNHRVEKRSQHTYREENHGVSNGECVAREDTKKKLHRLRKLYADEENLSPVHETESRPLHENKYHKEKIQWEKPEDIVSDKQQKKGRKGLGGLVALAKNMNQWEDDLSRSKRENTDTKTTTQRKWKPPAPRPPITNTRSPENLAKNSTPRKIKQQAPQPPVSVADKTNSNTINNKPKSPNKSPVVTPKSNNSSTTNSSKQLNLDPAVLEILESQGFTRTTSNTRLIYNYSSQESRSIKMAEIKMPAKIINNNNDHIIEEEEEEEEEEESEDQPAAESKKVIAEKQPFKAVGSPTKNNIKGPTVADRAAIFEAACSPNKNTNKDPALLSVSERKALFEKNKGKALIPKAPISLAPLSPGKTKFANHEVKCTNTVSPAKETKTITSTNNEKPMSSLTSKEKSLVKNKASIKSPTRFPPSRPPIRKNDAVDSSSYRIPEGQPGGIASKVAALFQNKSTIGQKQIENHTREQRQKEMDILLNRFQNNKEIAQSKTDFTHHSESDSDNEEITEITAMITEKPPQIIKTPDEKKLSSSVDKKKSSGKRCSKTDSPKVTAALDDVKRIKVIGAKPGKLYPCLSDIEAATETETEIENNTASPTPNNSSSEDIYPESDAEAADTSFGREILQTVCKNQIPRKRLIYDESTESDLSDILDDTDEYLDEAVAYGASDKSGPTPPKQSRSLSPINNVPQPSNSFQYKDYSPCKGSPQKNGTSENNFKSPSKVQSTRKSNELPAYVVDGDNVLPLTHTVSFYRRQQTQQGSKSPVRQIVRNQIVEESSESAKSTSNEESEVQAKIQHLVKEITKQQTIISQTSRALNLCYATPEFTGSTEQVEAEKVLLLATHRRSAAQREIERLSVLRTLHHDNSIIENVPLEKGRLTISSIVLPLKREYVRALNATGGKGHHVVCLIKCAEHVHATRLVSTVATNDRNPNLELMIPGTIHLNDIYSNFTVQFEVYCLQAQEEILSHEVKYHINKKANNKSTPKKTKPESRLIKPPKESPGGPQAVRSPTFALMGYVVFSIQAINRKNWTLNNTPSMSPLEGIVEMRVKCELALSVEHCGFLTMFEDISGFGAWHRRWCLLKGHILSYWKYPEEEKKKTAIGSIDLKTCITQQIGPVRRDICARLHTILIETRRPAEPHDKDSLVTECNGDTTVIRHLLSADTKEEKNEWCSMFNKSLTTMKISKNLK